MSSSASQSCNKSQRGRNTPTFLAREILTLIAWLIYAVLLHERLTVGWRGRRASWLAILGFLVLAVTFVGANLWISGYHSFSKFVQP